MTYQNLRFNIGIVTDHKAKGVTDYREVEKKKPKTKTIEVGVRKYCGQGSVGRHTNTEIPQDNEKDCGEDKAYELEVKNFSSTRTI